VEDVVEACNADEAARILESRDDIAIVFITGGPVLRAAISKRGPHPICAVAAHRFTVRPDCGPWI
jgi:hypothetical protein